MYVPVALEKQLEVTHVITSFDEIRPCGYYFSGEMHDFWEIAYVLEGTIVVTAEDRVYTLAQGNMIFHQPLEFHSLRCAENTAARLLVISFSARGEAMETLRQRVMDLEYEEEASLLQTVQLLHTFLETREPALGAQGRARLEALLWTLSAKPVRTVERHTDSAVRLYGEAMRILNEHVRESLTLRDVARLCGTSESSLKKAFAACSHTGVMHSFLSLKIRVAAQLLRQGLSAVQVSEQLGFSSPSYFHVAFRREMHCTPGQYIGRGQT